MLQPPTLEEVNNHLMSWNRNYEYQHGNREIVTVYKSVHTFGSWFGTWWTLELELMNPLELEGREYFCGRNNIPIKSLMDAFENAYLTAHPYSIWPFLYMDQVPDLISYKGDEWAERAAMHNS